MRRDGGEEDGDGEEDGEVELVETEGTAVRNTWAKEGRRVWVQLPDPTLILISAQEGLMNGQARGAQPKVACSWPFLVVRAKAASS